MARFCVVVTLAVCCLITCSNGSKDWLSSACFEDECPEEQNATCYGAECLCIPGYYYSEGQKTCVKECAKSDLKRIPVMYQSMLINGTLIDKATKPNEAECWNWCSSMSECRASVYNYVTKECTIPKATNGSLSTERWNYDWNSITHMMRCA